MDPSEHPYEPGQDPYKPSGTYPWWVDMFFWLPDLIGLIGRAVWWCIAGLASLFTT